MKRIHLLSLSGLALLASASAPGRSTRAEATDQGYEIAREAERRDLGFGDHRANLEMTLVNRHGEKSVRQLETLTLEQQKDGDHTLVVFHSPEDVKGTALLTHAHVTGNDDQWLFLPAVKRTKRVSAGNRSGPFMGSEFAFEDLSSPELEEYRYRFLREEAVEREPCWIIERIPRDPSSGYTRQEVAIDKQHYLYRKVIFYDRKGTLLKTLAISQYQQYLNRWWRPKRAEMSNQQTGKRTLLVWRDYKFKSGLTVSDFDPGGLTRWAR
jgi:hypothetical protein